MRHAKFVRWRMVASGLCDTGCGAAQGDWGTQFGMLIQHIAETRQGGLQGTTTEDVADLQARLE